MIRTLGLLETNSIVKGIETADQMTKTASISLVQAKPVCPGKYMIIISGDVGSVKSAMEAGENTAGTFLVDTLIIPSLHEQVIDAITAAGDVEPDGAFGAAEFFSLAAAVAGADAAVKAANVQLIEIRLGLGIGGKSYFTLTGELGAVEEAVQAGTSEAAEKGLLVTSTVIPNMLDKEIWQFLL